jgi:hypothetical protein
MALLETTVVDDDMAILGILNSFDVEGSLE